MKTSSIAVETSRSTSQSDSIVRQTNKRSFPTSYFIGPLPLICTSIVFRDRPGIVMSQSLLSSQLITNNLSNSCRSPRRLDWYEKKMLFKCFWFSKMFRTRQNLSFCLALSRHALREINAFQLDSLIHSQVFLFIQLLQRFLVSVNRRIST